MPIKYSTNPLRRTADQFRWCEEKRVRPFGRFVKTGKAKNIAKNRSKYPSIHYLW